LIEKWRRRGSSSADYLLKHAGRIPLLFQPTVKVGGCEMRGGAGGGSVLFKKFSWEEKRRKHLVASITHVCVCDRLRNKLQ